MTRDDERAAAGVHVDVLGPLRLIVDGRPVDVPGPRRRAVLALLVMANGRTVSVDALLDAVWPEVTPESGRRALHSHVSRLRGHLGRHAEALERDGNGYRMRLERDAVDVSVVRSAVSEARGVRERDPAGAAGLLAEALELWQGVALEEFTDIDPLAADAIALSALRADIVDEWLDARLAAGGDRDLVADASRAAKAAPLRERTAMLLVRALAAEGRQSDAMRAAHTFRSHLGEETGFDPTPAFAELERDVATGVAAPAPQPRAEPAAPSRRRARPATPIIGRDRELAQVLRNVREVRLVTIVGPGGVGKTRLALEAAAELGGDDRAVHVVELATVSDARHTIDALAATLGLRANDHSSVLDAASAVLSSTPTVLVVDNCEHLIDSCRDLVSTVLASADGLAVLATSREPLDIPAEHLIRLGPLPVPDDAAAPAEIEQAAAVTAFVAHAQRRSPDFALTDDTAADVAEIVRRLDGLPLALELAAGRVGTLGIADVRDRLGRALDLLGSGRSSADSRHRTLRSTIDWSYQLLAGDERTLLRAMAAFPGGLDLDGVERLAVQCSLSADAAAIVARLVDASVVVATTAGARTRFRLLETVRAFAADETAKLDEGALVDDHLVASVIDLVATLHAMGRGPREREAQERLTAELPNIRAAHDVVVRRGDVDSRVAIVLQLHELGISRAFPELHVWSIDLAVLAKAQGRADAPRALGAASRAAWLRGELERAFEFGNDALALSDDETQLEVAYDSLAIVALLQGDFERCVELDMRAAEIATPDRAGTYVATAALAVVYAGDEQRARELLDRARELSVAAQAGSDLAFTRYCEGELLARHDLAAAVEAYEEAIALARTVNASFVEGVATVGLVSAWSRSGRLVEALGGYRWLVDYWRRAGHWTQMWTTMRNLALTLASAGDAESAAFVLAAVAHAEGAATLDAETAEQQAQLHADLEQQLGADAMARQQSRAAALPRATVVEEVLHAVDAALRDV